MPLFWLSLAFLAGILLGDFLSWPWISWGLLSGLSLTLIVFRRYYRSLLKIIIPSKWIEFIHRLASEQSLAFPAFWLILLLLCLGGLRYQLTLPDLDDPNFIAYYNDNEEQIVVQGVLVKPPEERDGYTNLIIEVDQMHAMDDPRLSYVHGKVLVKDWSRNKFRYGDRLVVSGSLQTPHDGEEFSYREYLAHQGIYAFLEAWEVSLIVPASGGNPMLRSIYTLRDRSHQLVYRLWPDPEASLLAGILLGIETNIPDSVKQDFKETGTSHIIAISGFNITIIAGLFAIFFNRLLGRWRGALVATLGIAGYTLLVGADPAVVRAAIMGGLTLFARQIGRQQTGLNSLTIVAAMMAAFDPHAPWIASFQLSFMATLGLVLYAEPLSQGLVRIVSLRVPLSSAQRLAGPAGEYFLFTLAALFTSLPVTIYLTRRFSLSSLLANPLILPAQPLVMMLGGLAVVTGLISLPLGQLLAYLAWPGVVYTIRIVELVARITDVTFTWGSFSLLVVLLYYSGLFSLTLVDPLRRRFLAALRNIELANDGSWRSALIALSLLIPAVLNVVAWREVFNLPDGHLHMTVLDVSDNARQGDAILIQGPTGCAVLINGGPSSTRLSDYLGRRLPLFRRQLEFLVVAAAEKQKIEALTATIDRFPPRNVIWAGPASPDANARSLRHKFNVMGVRIIPAQNDQTLDLGEGALLRVLVAGKRGGIFSLEWVNFRALIPIGANFEDLEVLDYGEDIGPVTALLLGDNGHPPSNPPEWISNLDPQVILFSGFSSDNSVLSMLNTAQKVEGYNLLRTDQDGSIHLSTDGEDMWVEIQRR